VTGATKRTLKNPCSGMPELTLKDFEIASLKINQRGLNGMATKVRSQ
jgi:hypothetical protein